MPIFTRSFLEAGYILNISANKFFICKINILTTVYMIVLNAII